LTIEDRPGNGRIEATLAKRVSADPRAHEIAVATRAICSEIDAALSPIIGQRGVAALYKRSLYVLGASHPALTVLHENVLTTMDLDALRAVIADQGDADALAGSVALLHSFHALLTSLVGSSLTERLLHPVWESPASVTTVQDSPQ
jgi:hypothetical protein